MDSATTFSPRPRLTAAQRTALAKRLRRLANSKSGLTPEKRQEARRHASNLEKINSRKT